MMKVSVSILLLALCCVVLVQAAPSEAKDLVGKWQGKTESQRGVRETTLTFKMEGGKLVGESLGSRGGARPLSEVVLKADGTLTFTQTFSRQGNAMTIKFAGKLAGDAITGEFDYGQRGKSPFTAKRVKAE